MHAWRIAVGSGGRPSPAWNAFRAARLLHARGFDVPPVLAAVEYRRFGALSRSFFLTREVADALPADRWWARLADEPPAQRLRGRRALAVALGDLFRRLHAAGVYHNDLKDVNVLVHGPIAALRCVLLDLERVAIGEGVSPRRRVKNVVQLERTLGRAASAANRLRFLRAYLGEDWRDREQRRSWVRRILGAAVRKEQQRERVRPAPPATEVTCTIVCQDEAQQIGGCLESVDWCGEIVVVDGGSRDGTAEIARRFTERVIQHPWPGYRAQKQFALEAARGDWVLNLDADERVTPELASEIRAALTWVDDPVDGFRIPRLVSYLGRWWYRGGWYPRPVLRLVRRARTTWGGTDPHDRAVIPGRVVGLRRPILHYTYDDISDHLRSVEKLTAVAAAQVPPGRRVGLGRLVGEPAWRFVRSWIIKRGVREGFPGLFVAATDAFYTFLRWARVWERERARKL